MWLITQSATTTQRYKVTAATATTATTTTLTTTTTTTKTKTKTTKTTKTKTTKTKAIQHQIQSSNTSKSYPEFSYEPYLRTTIPIPYNQIAICTRLYLFCVLFVLWKWVGYFALKTHLPLKVQGEKSFLVWLREGVKK